jgi:prepilin-type N-terminal cleavage/methylation domain-containing protein
LKSRSGFTLIEVLVSIVLTAVVSLLVYGAAQAARDTESRIGRERHGLESSLAMRMLLQSALADAQNLALDGVFLLVPSRTQGIPRDKLTFVTASDFPPLSGGADWIVTVEPSAAGLRLTGGPLGIRTPARVLATLPGITGLEIRVRHQQLAPEWTESWDSRWRLPQAVKLTYWTDAGPVGVPLVTALGAGSDLAAAH